MKIFSRLFENIVGLKVDIVSDSELVKRAKLAQKDFETGRLKKLNSLKDLM